MNLVSRCLALSLLALCAGCAADPVVRVGIGGGCDERYAGTLSPSRDAGSRRVTYCEQGEPGHGVLETTLYPAGTRAVDVMVAGFPDHETIRVELRSRDQTRVARVAVPRSGNHWLKAHIEVPADFLDTDFSIRLTDEGPSWAGLAYLIPRSPAHIFSRAVIFALPPVFGHLWLCLLALLLPATWGVRWRAVGALVIFGALGFAAFLGYLPGPSFGRAFAMILLALPILAVLVVSRPRRRAMLADFGPISLALLPPLALAIFVLWVGYYPFSWHGDIWTEAARRWLVLPLDNWIPYLFADMMQSGVLRRPMVGDWLSSDRPPLLTGIVLLGWALPGNHGIIFQSLSTWCQCLLLVPVTMLARQAVGRRARLVPFVLGASPFMMINGLFVWPKALAGCFAGLFHLLVFLEVKPEHQRKVGAAAGAAAGLALLSHGASIWALAGSGVAFLWIRRGAAARTVPTMALVAALFMAPWVSYQKFIDPPGDRLIKYHLAGHPELTSDSVSKTLADAYGSITLPKWLEGRWADVDAIAGGGLTFTSDLVALALHPDPRGPGNERNTIQKRSFFWASYCWWFFGPLSFFAVIVLAERRGVLTRSLWPSGMIPALAVSMVLWIATVFLPGETIVHQGPYFSLLCIPLLCMLPWAVLAPRVFVALAALNTLLLLVLYVFDLPLAGIQQPWLYALGSLSLLGVFLRSCLASTSGVGEALLIGETARTGSLSARPDPRGRRFDEDVPAAGSIATSAG